MDEYYFKLHYDEARKIAKKFDKKLPPTRRKLKVKNTDKQRDFIKDIHKYRIYLNKARTIYMQPCHFYDGIKHQFTHEIGHFTTNSAFYRWAKSNSIPLRSFTY